MWCQKLSLLERTAIHAPVDVVWAAFSDLGSWPRWNTVCLKATGLAGKPWTVGFRFRMVLRMAGVPVSFTPTVVEADAPYRVAWSSRRFTVTGARSFTFEPAPEGTLVVDEMRFSSRVTPVRLFYPRPVIAAMSKGWLASLKEEAERRFRG